MTCTFLRDTRLPIRFRRKQITSVHFHSASYRRLTTGEWCMHNRQWLLVIQWPWKSYASPSERSLSPLSSPSCNYFTIRTVWNNSKHSSCQPYQQADEFVKFKLIRLLDEEAPCATEQSNCNRLAILSDRLRLAWTDRLRFIENRKLNSKLFKL